ncbi:MAG: hypothetical protein H0X15_09315 [Acidobacteria bacterium]|nr:hypothetical protein [Acidobacteriota bacterium]
MKLFTKGFSKESAKSNLKGLLLRCLRYFVLTITLRALGSLVVGNFQAANGFDIKFVNGLASLLLIALAVYLVITALIKLGGEKRGELAAENA